MIERTASVIGLLILAGGLGAAQSPPPWRAPTGGFYFDRLSAGLRPIFGSIGSAQLGPVWLDEIQFAAPAPDFRSAVVQRAGVVYWIPELSPRADLARPLETSAITGARWSADARRAIFVHAAGVSWWNREGNDLQLTARWPLAEDSTWELLAAAPGAQTVLLAEKTPGGTRHLWMATDRTLPQRLDSPAPRSAAFLGSTGRVAVLDDTGRIHLWRGLNSGTAPAEGIPQREELADASELSPSAITASTDGQRLFLISREHRALETFVLQTRAWGDRQELGFEPRRADLIGAGHVLLNDRTTVSDPLRVLDLSLDRVFFVPAGPDSL